MVPHLRRLPERVDRILSLTGRGELRIRTVVDEDSRRILRTLVNRLLLVLAGAALLFVSAMLLVASDAGPRSPARPACSRSSATAACSLGFVLVLRVVAAVVEGRHDMSRHPDGGRSPASTSTSGRPGERYYRHPGDVVRLVLWGLATLALVLFIEVANGDQRRLRDDLGDAAALFPPPSASSSRGRPDRRQSSCRSSSPSCSWPSAAGGVAGAGAGRGRRRRRGSWLLDRAVGLAGPVTGALDDDSWLISSGFPSPVLLAAAAAATAVGKAVAVGRRGAGGRPGARVAHRDAGARRHRRPGRAAAGHGGGQPHRRRGARRRRRTQPASERGRGRRRPRPGRPRRDRARAGRAVGGRSQLYRAPGPTARGFVKVYARDSRDADLLYRGYRTALLREPVTSGPARRSTATSSTKVCPAARRAAASPARDLRAVAPSPTARWSWPWRTSPAVRSTRSLPKRSAPSCSTAVGGRPPRSTPRARPPRLRPANIVVAEDGPVHRRSGTAEAPAVAPAAGDRSGRAARLARRLVGPEDAVLRGRVIHRGDLAAAPPYLQPLALSAATRKATSKSMLRTLRDGIAAATGQEPEPLEQLVRVRPRTLVMIATLTGAFYFLLPQLANVDDSIRALRSANWAWLAGAVVMSGCTYVAAAIGLAGGVRQRLPFGPDRRGPAGLVVRQSGHAGQRRRHGDSTSATCRRRACHRRGGDRHRPQRARRRARPRRPARRLLRVGGPSGGAGVLPTGQQQAARRDRRSARRRSASSSPRDGAGACSRKHVCGRRSSRSPALVPSPARRAGSLQLFGGSIGVTLAYIAALACAAAAFDGGAELCPDRRGLPRRVAHRRRRTDTGRAGRDGGRARRRVHRRRHGRRRSPSPPCSATGWRRTGCRSCPDGSASGARPTQLHLTRPGLLARRSSARES